MYLLQSETFRRSRHFSYYVPKSYQEFVEKEDEQIHEKGKTEVHRLDEKGDRTVELTQGKVSIRIEQKDLPEMIRLLKSMLDD